MLQETAKRKSPLLGAQRTWRPTEKDKDLSVRWPFITATLVLSYIFTLSSTFFILQFITIIAPGWTTGTRMSVGSRKECIPLTSE